MGTSTARLWAGFIELFQADGDGIIRDRPTYEKHDGWDRPTRRR